MIWKFGYVSGRQINSINMLHGWLPASATHKVKEAISAHRVFRSAFVYILTALLKWTTDACRCIATLLAPTSHNPLSYSPSKSSSSSSPHPPFLRLTTILSSSLLFSATAPRSSFSCSSVTFCRSCPDLASVMSLFSTSTARDSFTSRIRFRRSMASGRRIWFRMDLRASARKKRVSIPVSR